VRPRARANARRATARANAPTPRRAHADFVRRGFRSTRDGARTRDAEDGATTTRATRRRATARREGDEGRD